MASDVTYRVFVSYTGQDLEAHAEVVSDMIKRLNADTDRSWIAIDHKFWSPSGRPSVKECREQVERCQILVVLVAYRYGWVPTVDEGGDGESSITRMEVEWARAAGLVVIPFLVEDEATWPVSQIEGIADPVAQQRLDRFKSELRKSLAGFFEKPASLEAQTVLALNKAAERIERTRIPAQPKARADVAADEDDLVVPAYFDPKNPPGLAERMQTHLPKRILSLDSRGVGTAVVLGYLARLEQLLCARYGDADFRLSDYYDLIGASGASAVVAVELARGRKVADARNAFVECLTAMLSAQRNLLASFSTKYRAQGLQAFLGRSLGGLTIRSSDLRTGLALALSRVDTAQTLSVCNHPRASSLLIGEVPLAQVVAACMATPMMLPPVELKTDDGSGSFMTGELTVGPDPALHLFLVATSPGFPFRWRTGRRRLALTSLGAGVRPVIKQTPGTLPLSAITFTLNSMVAGLRQQSDLVLAALTHEESAEAPGAETPASAQSAVTSILRYRRFDVALDATSLADLGLPELAADAESLATIDRADRIPAHLEIGRRSAERLVDASHFSRSFDVRPGPVERNVS